MRTSLKDPKPKVCTRPNIFLGQGGRQNRGSLVGLGGTCIQMLDGGQHI